MPTVPFYYFFVVDTNDAVKTFANITAKQFVKLLEHLLVVFVHFNYAMANERLEAVLAALQDKLTNCHALVKCTER